MSQPVYRFFAYVIAFAAVSMMLYACDGGQKKLPTYSQGDVVIQKLTGVRGVVLYMGCNSRACTYDVRFGTQVAEGMYDFELAGAD